MIINNGDNIELNKGDTGNIAFTSLYTDKLYTGYMAINNEEGTKILKEITSTSYDQTNGIAVFTITNAISDTFPVGEYPYSLKLCATTSSGAKQEDTVIPELVYEDGVFSRKEAPTITILPKKAEGTI